MDGCLGCCGTVSKGCQYAVQTVVQKRLAWLSGSNMYVSLRILGWSYEVAVSGLQDSCMRHAADAMLVWASLVSASG